MNHVPSAMNCSVYFEYFILSISIWKHEVVIYFITSCFSEKMNQVPNSLATYMSRKQYLNATKLLVEAVNLGKGTLEGVESLKELSLELEQKKEVIICICRNTDFCHSCIFSNFICSFLVNSNSNSITSHLNI